MFDLAGLLKPRLGDCKHTLGCVALNRLNGPRTQPRSTSLTAKTQSYVQNLLPYVALAASENFVWKAFVVFVVTV